MAGLAAAVLVAFPTGDLQAKIVARYQEPVLAAMEGRFETGPMAEITLIGQPNVKERRIDNPIKIPGVLSFLAYGTFHSDVRGLDAFPPDTWPTNIELLYYAFHVMAGLGTMFIALMGLANLQRFRGRLEPSPVLLWVLMLAFPFPYIANTAGWMTTELGRQPWLIYGLYRTQDGYSDVVSSGDVLFTLIGMAGLYFVLGLLFLYLVGREILHGPEPRHRRGGARMVEVWFGLLCFTLMVFVVLDGWNIGAGAAALIAGKTGAERREIVAAIGPLWSWHEVWLRGVRRHVPARLPESHGHLVRRVLPRALARALVVHPARHLPRGRRPHRRQAVAIVVGLRLRRVERAARRAVWCRARQRDPGRAPRRAAASSACRSSPTLACAAEWGSSTGTPCRSRCFTTVLLAAHGATYLRLKTIGRVHQRSERLARQLWTTALVLFAVISLETWVVRPALYEAMVERPLAWLAIAVVVAGAWALVTGLRGTAEPRLCRIVRGDRRPPGRRRGQRVSRDAALDARARALDDRL